MVREEEGENPCARGNSSPDTARRASFMVELKSFVLRAFLLVALSYLKTCRKRLQYDTNR